MAKSIREQIAAQEAAIVKAQGALAKAQAAIEELKTKLGDEVDFAAIVPEATVVFDYGKGESVREYTGMVLAIKVADPAVAKSAPQARVAIGDGFEADVKTIYFAQVKKVFPKLTEQTDPATV